MMKSLRYIVILILIGLVGGRAYAVTYGKPYHPQYSQTNNFSTYASAEMPTVAMNHIDNGFMLSGSSLPMAAATGVLTTYDTPILRTVGEGGSTADDEDPDAPTEPMPIGNTPWILFILMLGGYALVKRRRVLVARGNIEV